MLLIYIEYFIYANSPFSLRGDSKRPPALKISICCKKTKEIIRRVTKTDRETGTLLNIIPHREGFLNKSRCANLSLEREYQNIDACDGERNILRIFRNFCVYVGPRLKRVPNNVQYNNWTNVYL